MNTSAILNLLEQYGLGLITSGLPLVAALYVAAHPGVTADDAVAEIEGEVKHQLRGRVGVLVDFVWPWVEPDLRPAIVTAVNTAMVASNAPASVGVDGAVLQNGS